MILGIVFAVATFFFALAKGTNKNASPYVLIFGAFFLPIIVFAIFAKIALQFEDDNSPKNGANARVNDSSFNSQQPESANSQPANPNLGKTTPSSGTLARFSTGYDWKRADDATKREFCDKMATAMSREFHRSFTGDFFYSALETFYDSSDPNILREKVIEIVGLTTTAAIK